MDWSIRLFRTALLALANRPALEALAVKYGPRLGADRFIAGTTAEEALKQVAHLNGQGIAATLDYLGESVLDPDRAEESRQTYIGLLAAIAERRLDANVSLKPTQMGLAIREELALNHIRSIVQEGKRHSLFVRIDMENTPYTDATIRIVRQLHAEGLTNVGTVIQAYLRRSEADVMSLTEAGVNLRLVKGAYKEPAALAFPAMSDVNESFRRLIRMRLDSGVYTAVATHDDQLIDWTCDYAKRSGIAADRYEFQMLYGIRTPLQQSLARLGYRVRCYVPFGERWYPYFVRRLVERPANLWFVLKNGMKG